ncbi:hypothetical protein [Cellulosimicrobium sp. Marseille-Q4280]|uniref:hypothetical protein n=1 Tax=Cellulosimicrobium sp. Marseille-Q4280 TaxID=2937992 RepID=UPI00203E1AA8|nr:hypothetical protein [Cellulosimicrobium sp. Marseille-Q4280]
MTTYPVDPRDARRLAAAKGISYAAAQRELAALDPNRHLGVVRAARARSLGWPRWADRAADDFASELPRRHPAGALAAAKSTTAVLHDAWYASALVVDVNDVQHVDDYDGDELWNLTFTLEVEVTGLLDTYRAPESLSAEGLKADDDYGPDDTTVHVAGRRVEVTVAGLRALDGEDAWQEQEILSAVWL